MYERVLGIESPILSPDGGEGMELHPPYGHPVGGRGGNCTPYVGPYFSSKVISPPYFGSYFSRKGIAPPYVGA